MMGTACVPTWEQSDTEYILTSFDRNQRHLHPPGAIDLGDVTLQGISVMKCDLIAVLELIWVIREHSCVRKFKFIFVVQTVAKTRLLCVISRI
jgi:hypothetical protein